MKSDWRSVRFGQITVIASGLVDPKKALYRDSLHVGPDNIETDTGSLSELKTASEQNLISGKYAFDDNAIIYSKIRPNLNKVCHPGFSGICSADAYAIWVRPEFADRNYLLQVMRSELFVDQAVSVSMRTGMPKINQAELNQLAVPPRRSQSKEESPLSSSRGIGASDRRPTWSSRNAVLSKCLSNILLSGKPEVW